MLNTPKLTKPISYTKPYVTPQRVTLKQPTNPALPPKQANVKRADLKSEIFNAVQQNPELMNQLPQLAQFYMNNRGPATIGNQLFDNVANQFKPYQQAAQSLHNWRSRRGALQTLGNAFASPINASGGLGGAIGGAAQLATTLGVDQHAIGGQLANPQSPASIKLFEIALQHAPQEPGMAGRLWQWFRELPPENKMALGMGLMGVLGGIGTGGIGGAMLGLAGLAALAYGSNALNGFSNPKYTDINQYALSGLKNQPGMSPKDQFENQMAGEAHTIGQSNLAAQSGNIGQLKNILGTQLPEMSERGISALGSNLLATFKDPAQIDRMMPDVINALSNPQAVQGLAAKYGLNEDQARNIVNGLQRVVPLWEQTKGMTPMQRQQALEPALGELVSDWQNQADPYHWLGKLNSNPAFRAGRYTVDKLTDMANYQGLLGSKAQELLGIPQQQSNQPQPQPGQQVTPIDPNAAQQYEQNMGNMTREVNDSIIKEKGPATLYGMVGAAGGAMGQRAMNVAKGLPGGLGLAGAIRGGLYTPAAINTAAELVNKGLDVKNLGWRGMWDKNYNESEQMYNGLRDMPLSHGLFTAVTTPFTNPITTALNLGHYYGANPSHLRDNIVGTGHITADANRGHVMRQMGTGMGLTGNSGQTPPNIGLMQKAWNSKPIAPLSKPIIPKQPVPNSLKSFNPFSKVGGAMPAPNGKLPVKPHQYLPTKKLPVSKLPPAKPSIFTGNVFNETFKPNSEAKPNSNAEMPVVQ